MANQSTVFDLLADPTRRRIIERLGEEPSSVGKLAAVLPVTRPAVSQHLKRLKEAGLVTDISDGTRRIYRLDPRGLAAMRDWLDRHWKSALGQFQAFAKAEAEAAANPQGDDQ